VTFVPGGSMYLNVTTTPSTCNGVTQPYTGALVSTNPYDGRDSGGFQYQYGVLEAKVFIPAYDTLAANWPTIETLGQVWPGDGEDDIMEVLYGKVCFNFHSPGYLGGAGLGTCEADIHPGWHLIAADWEPGVVTYYCDGVEIGQITQGITSAPMYILMVNTVGLFSQGTTRADGLRIPFVRVWQRNPPTPKASTWGCNTTSSLLQGTDGDHVPCWLTEFGSTALRP
jgi:beta-glucanase (GH16 family)